MFLFLLTAGTQAKHENHCQKSTDQPLHNEISPFLFWALYHTPPENATGPLFAVL